MIFAPDLETLETIPLERRQAQRRQEFRVASPGRRDGDLETALYWQHVHDRETRNGRGAE